MSEATPPEDVIARLIDTAEAMGVELDHDEAAAWIAAMRAESTGSISVDVDSGVYGHRVTMVDHDAEGLDRFRRMMGIVGFEDRPPEVTTALALSGSAAQSRIHAFPADADFFERIHIRAPSQADACRILGDLMRDKALATLRLPGCRLQEVKLGSWPEDAQLDDGRRVRYGSPVSWGPADVEAGAIVFRRPDGSDGRLRWEDAAQDPGWCKLDWVIADPADGSIHNASNVLDPTWEAPDGTVVPLDGFLDPYFQEVYLETDSIPLFSRLVKELGADSVAEYVERLTEEVRKYTVKERNYGKAARRMYNVFRLTGRYAEAAYVRELFDEPVAALYQVAALLRTLDEAHAAGDAFDAEAMVAQVDGLIMSAIAALEGHAEAEMVRRLLRVRDAVSRRAEAGADGGDEGGGGMGEGGGEGRGDGAPSHRADLEAAQADAMATVNEYFERVLTGVPEIRTWLEEVAGDAKP